MKGSDFIHRRASRADLDRAMERAEPHLRPIVQAVRDDRVGLMFVPQGSGAFHLPGKGKKAAITIIGDDMHEAHGPDGFHMPSLRRAIRASEWFAVVSSAPPADLYEAVAVVTKTTRRNTLLIETRPEQEIQWANLIRKFAPKRPLCLATVEGGRA